MRLRGTRVSRSLVEEAHGTDSSWTNVTVRDARFDDADLSGSVFVRCQFENVNFNDANLTGARFESCVLVDCLFFDTDVTSSVFTGSDLVYTTLEHATGAAEIR